MKSITRHIACFCENTFDAQVPESADLAEDHEVEAQILAGDFMAVSCPVRETAHAGVPLPAATGARGVGELFLVPEAHRNAFLREKLEYSVGAPARVVVGFAELAEKVLIFSKGLDDRVIEIMKYYLLTGAAGLSWGRGRNATSPFSTAARKATSISFTSSG